MKRLVLFVVLLALTVLLPGTQGVLAQPSGRSIGPQAFLQGTSWGQVNASGFGDSNNQAIWSLGEFNDTLYAGTTNPNGAQIWRLQSDGWDQVANTGFGDAYNSGVNHLLAFDGSLYAATANYITSTPNEATSEGGEIWRSPNGNAGSWTLAVNNGSGTDTADTANFEFFRFFIAASPDRICATTFSNPNVHGGEIWCSEDGADWARVISNGFGKPTNDGFLSVAFYGGKWYFGTTTLHGEGGEVWQTDADFSNPTQVNNAGFGEAGNVLVSSLVVFNDYLYAATHHAEGGGAQVWRCQTCSGEDWSKVVDNGFGDAFTRAMPGLQVYEGKLYLFVGNVVSFKSFETEGMQVWETLSGEPGSWSQDVSAGFNDINNSTPYYGNSNLVFEDQLLVGTGNMAAGGEIWELLLGRLYVPQIRK